MKCGKHDVEMKRSEHQCCGCCCGGCSREELYFCPACAEEKEAERKEYLHRIANIVVKHCDVYTANVNGRRIITSMKPRTAYYYMPHGGKQLQPGDYAKLNLKTGFLEKSEPDGNFSELFFVVE